MKTPANTRTANSATNGWLPAQAPKPRALDLTHWLTRAAHGHTWNGNGVQRRRSN